MERTKRNKDLPTSICIQFDNKLGNNMKRTEINKYVLTFADAYMLFDIVNNLT